VGSDAAQARAVQVDRHRRDAGSTEVGGPHQGEYGRRPKDLALQHV
jgi:hypothetical protein